MARIRSIKPEFPQSETVGALSRDARLLFIQIWTIVDDDGRARGSSRMLASLLYPYDDDAPKLIGGWLAELEGAACVRRYEIEGASYIDIPNWLKHQKIDKPSKSRLPPFDEASAKPREPSRNLAPDLGPRTLDQDLGKGPEDIRAVAKATIPDRDQEFEEFWKAYPKRDGANPKGPARKLFVSAVKSGILPSEITEGSRRYADDERRLGHIGTPLVAQAQTWLRQTRWTDYAATAPPVNGVPIHLQPPPNAPSLEEALATYGKPHAAEVGTEVRIDAGLGEDRTH